MGSQKKDPLVPAVVEEVRVGIKNLAKIQRHPFPAVLDYKTPRHSQCQWEKLLIFTDGLTCLKLDRSRKHVFV